MDNIFYSITRKDLLDLFARLSNDYNVFVPYKKGDGYFFGPFDPDIEGSIELGGVRQSQPLKSFISLPREKVLTPPGGARQVVVAGVKACDLAGLIVQDHVFLEGECKDSFYAFHRDNTLIISNDCTFARPTCFCRAMGGNPYPEKGFDLNLSDAGQSIIVEAGSPKGMALIGDYKTFFKVQSGADAVKREASRAKVASEIDGYVAGIGTPSIAGLGGAMKKSYGNLAMWQDFSSTCVECGACNLVCPTCHCFLLYDDKGKESPERTRIWDSCLYNTFARVAGNHNPRKHLYERLRNRMDKKFDFFPQIMGHYACTGCGRCIEACPGKIDIRQMLKGIAGAEWKRPPHE